MKIRTVLAALAVAGMATAASAQSSATFTWHWNLASDPIGTPAPAALMPGQSARVWLDIAYTPAVGSPLGGGTVQGFGTAFWDMIAGPNAEGAWVNAGAGFGGTANVQGPFTNFNNNNWGRRSDINAVDPGQNYGWGLGSWGQVLAAGNPQGVNAGSIWAASVGQLPLVGQTPNPMASPILEIWRGQFTPDSYAERTINWEVRAAAAGTGTGATIYIDTAGVTSAVNVDSINFGSLSIPVVPSPSSLALLGLGGLIVARRRR